MNKIINLICFLNSGMLTRMKGKDNANNFNITLFDYIYFKGKSSLVTQW